RIRAGTNTRSSRTGTTMAARGTRTRPMSVLCSTMKMARLTTRATPRFITVVLSRTVERRMVRSATA
ncbi:hypothetical protein LTS12_027815, partial [Elasticomyces elasticus]